MSNLNFSFNRVRISEYPGMVRGLLGVVEKHDPVTLKINPWYLRLQEKRPLLNLFNSLAKSEYSEPIKELRKQRRRVISVMLLLMKAAEKSSVPAIMAARAEILPVVQTYLEGVLVMNEVVIMEKVNGFTETYFASPELTESGNTLGIHVYALKLKELSDGIVEKENARTAAKAARRLADPVSLRKEISTDLRNLMSAIELAELENETIDYGLLNAELTQYLVPFNTLVRARTTRAKNREADNKTTAADTSSQTITAAM